MKKDSEIQYVNLKTHDLDEQNNDTPSPVIEKIHLNDKNRQFIKSQYNN